MATTRKKPKRVRVPVNVEVDAYSTYAIEERDYEGDPWRTVHPSEIYYDIESMDDAYWKLRALEKKGALSSVTLKRIQYRITEIKHTRMIFHSRHEHILGPGR